MSAETPPSLREQLLRAAIEMVRAEGVDAISVREVARRAGVSSGAPFRHFKDRDALLAAIAEDAHTRIEKATARALADADDDPVSQLEALGVCVALFAVRHPAHFRVMHLPFDGALHPSLAEAQSRQHDKLRELVVRGQQRGLLRDADTDTLVLFCHSLVSGLAQALIDGASKGRPVAADVDALARSVIELVGLGMLTEPEWRRQTKLRSHKRPAPTRAARPRARGPRRTTGSSRS